jgi:hypothetical protein
MELRKSNFEGPQLQPQLFLVRNPSAIDLVVRNIAELRRCGLKLQMPTFDEMTLHCIRIYDLKLLSS